MSESCPLTPPCAPVSYLVATPRNSRPTKKGSDGRQRVYAEHTVLRVRTGRSARSTTSRPHPAPPSSVERNCALSCRHPASSLIRGPRGSLPIAFPNAWLIPPPPRPRTRRPAYHSPRSSTCGVNEMRQSAVMALLFWSGASPTETHPWCTPTPISPPPSPIVTSDAPADVVSPHRALKRPSNAGRAERSPASAMSGSPGYCAPAKGDMTAPCTTQRSVECDSGVVATSWLRRIVGSQFHRFPDPENSGMPIAATLIGVSRETSGTSDPTMRDVRDQLRVAVVVRRRGSGKRRRSPGPFDTPPKKSISRSPMKLPPRTWLTVTTPPRRV